MRRTINKKEAAELFKSLSDETRLRIIYSLFEKEKCVNELVDELGLSQSHVSHHLKTLRHAGIVRCWKEGHRIYYKISPTIIKDFLGLKKGVLNLGCCEIKFKK